MIGTAAGGAPDEDGPGGRSAMRLVLPLIAGLLGTAILAGLGVWQLQRLDWKEGVIAEIAARIGSEAVPLPAAPDRDADAYRPVTLTGTVDGPALKVLGAWRNGGPGFRIVAPLETDDGRRVMVDLGVTPLDTADDDAPPVLPAGPLAILGNLDWPDDLNASTPPPDGDVWFARDVEGMADALLTERTFVVAREVVPPAGPAPVPVGLEGIPNSHLGYAIQWFGLAAVWLGMTGYLLWRISRRTV